MAEILGIISSAITIVEVAGKLGASTIRLKRLWDEVQNVPASIQRCIDQLELLGPAIDDMDIEFQKTRDITKNDTAAKRSIWYSRKAIETLETLVRDMEKQINSAKRSKKLVAQLKVRIKREVIEEHQQQLNSALQLVFLSQQTYLIALSRLQPEIIVSQIRDMEKGDCHQQISNDQAESVNQNSGPDDTDTKESLANKPTPVTSLPAASSTRLRVNRLFRWQEPGTFGGFAYQVDEVASNVALSRGLGASRLYRTRLQLPKWMIRKAWELQVLRASGGWTIQLKNWTTRPLDSDIFKFVRMGRIDLMLNAFRNNEASIYDRSPIGTTLVQFAIGYKNLEVVKTLDIMGLHFLEMEPKSIFSSIILWSWSDPNSVGMLELCHSYMTHVLEDATFETDKVEADQYERGFPDASIRFSREFYCVLWGVKGAWKLPFLTPKDVQQIMSEVDWIWVIPAVLLDWLAEESVILTHSRQGSSYLFGSPQIFAWRYFHALLNLEVDLEDWRLLARKIFVAAPPEETALSGDWQIPTVAGIIQDLWQRQFALRPFEQWLKKALAVWLEDLFEAGVDLEGYMIREFIGSRRDPNGFQGFDRPSNLQPGTRLSESGPSLVVLASGQAPIDWKFSWDPCVEELVGEFWTSVSCPEMIMPGAWVDDGNKTGGDKQCQMNDDDACKLATGQTFRRDDRDVLKYPRVRGMTSCKPWP